MIRHIVIRVEIGEGVFNLHHIGAKTMKIDSQESLSELIRIIEQRACNQGSTPWWFLGHLEEACREALPELLAARARIIELEAALCDAKVNPLALRR